MATKIKHSKKNTAILLFLAAIGIALFSVVNLRSIFWVDEGYSIRFVYCTFSEIWNFTAKDVHPPLYYLILKVYASIFGDSVIMLRFCSTLPIVALMIVGCFPIRKTFGDKTAIFFVLFLVSLPFMQYTSSEIRMYSWLMFFVTCTGLLAYLSVIKKSWLQWTLLTLFAICSCYTHNFGVLSTAMIYVVLFFHILRKDKKLLKYCLISGILVAILYLPWLTVLLSQASRIRGHYWISTPSAVDIGLIMYYPIHMKTWVIWNIKFIAVESIILLFWIYFIYKAYTKRSQYAAIWTASCLCFLVYFCVLGLSILISYTYMPIFVNKYLTGTLGLFILGISLAMAMVDYEKIFNKIILVLLILIISGTSLYRMYSDKEYHEFSGKGYKEISSYLNDKITPNDAILNIDELFVVSGMYSAMYPHNTSYILTDDDFEKHHATDHYKLSHIYSLNQLDNKHGRIFYICQNKNSDRIKNNRDSLTITENYKIMDRYDGDNVIIYQLEKRTDGKQ